MYKNNKNHIYLFIIVVIFFLIFYCYAFRSDHKLYINKNPFWEKIFKSQGISENDFKYISHDDDCWYYKDSSTCVGYGYPKDECKECKYYEHMCAGSDKKSYGTYEQQAKMIKDFIDNGLSKDCPLIYFLE